MCMEQRRNLSVGITVNLENYENLRMEVSGEVSTENDADELIAYLDTILSRMGRGTPETAERVDSFRKRVLDRPAIPASSEEAEDIAALPGGIPGQPPSALAPVPSPVAPGGTVHTLSPTAHPAQPGKQPATGQEISSAGGHQESAASFRAPEEPRTSPSVKASVPRRDTSPATSHGSWVPAEKHAEVSLPKEREVISPAPVVASSAPTAPPKSILPPHSPAESKDTLKGEGFICERCGEPITPVQRKLSRMFQNKDLCKKCLQQL